MVQTRFKLPAWITQKSLKILSRTNSQGKESSNTLEAETLRRKQDDKMNKLSEEVKLIKKDVESMKYDIKDVLSILKTENDDN